jgi:hypothetical protein
MPVDSWVRSLTCAAAWVQAQQQSWGGQVGKNSRKRVGIGGRQRLRAGWPAARQRACLLALCLLPVSLCYRHTAPKASTMMASKKFRSTKKTSSMKVQKNRVAAIPYGDVV